MPKYRHNSVILMQTCALFNCSKKKNPTEEDKHGKNIFTYYRTSHLLRDHFSEKLNHSKYGQDTRQPHLCYQIAILTGLWVRILL